MKTARQSLVITALLLFTSSCSDDQGVTPRWQPEDQEPELERPAQPATQGRFVTLTSSTCAIDKSGLFICWEANDRALAKTLEVNAQGRRWVRATLSDDTFCGVSDQRKLWCASTTHQEWAAQINEATSKTAVFDAKLALGALYLSTDEGIFVLSEEQAPTTLPDSKGTISAPRYLQFPEGYGRKDVIYTLDTRGAAHAHLEQEDGYESRLVNPSLPFKGLFQGAGFVFAVDELGRLWGAPFLSDAWTPDRRFESPITAITGVERFDLLVVLEGGEVYHRKEPSTYGGADWHIEREGIGQELIEIQLGEPSCGLNKQGEIFCWGDSSSYQWWQNDLTPHSALPVRIDPNHQFKKLVRAHSSICGLTAQGEILCMGELFVPQVDPEPSSTLTRVLPQVNAVDIVMGTNSICAQKREELSWVCSSDLRPIHNKIHGYPGEYVEGDATPVEISTEHQLHDLSISRYLGAGIDERGRAVFWGSMAQLATAVRDMPLIAYLLEAPWRWRSIHSHDHALCGIATDDWIWCFEWVEQKSFRVQLPPGFGRAQQLSSNRVNTEFIPYGDSTFCALGSSSASTSSMVACWSFKETKLRDRLREERAVVLTAEPLFEADSLVELLQHRDTVCALDDKETLHCADGSTSALHQNALTDKVLTMDHGCGLDERGALWCWGHDHQRGLLGRPTPSLRPSRARGWEEIAEQIAQESAQTR